LSAYDADYNRCLELAFQLGLLDPREEDSARQAFFHLMVGSMKPFKWGPYSFSDDEYAKKMRDLSRSLIQELKFSPPPRKILFLHRKLGGIFQILRRLDVTLDLAPFLESYRRLAEQKEEKSK
jgi:aarF domain-containing kinase